MPKDRRHAAIMFTDIVGYTSMMGSDEDQAFEILAKNREIHNQLVAKYNGTLIKEMGDGNLISFNLASDAVRCAIEIQKECKKIDIPLKIGIHEGEMVFVDSDVHGDGVNIASRIQDNTAGGCISISESVFRDIKNKAGIDTEFMEEKRFKNVHEPIKIYKVLCDNGRTAAQSSTLVEAPIPIKKSIIVLPFVNMSPDADQEYFSDGLTEEIITDLSHIRDLLVISRSSSMTFKNSNNTIREIAAKVNVQYVLEGSVRKAGNNLRITAQLIDAGRDVHLWAEKYSGTLDDVFDIQEKVSRSIADALKINLNQDEERKLIEHPIQDIDANDFYLRARYDIMRFTDESLKRALVSLHSAIELVGENARLFAEIGFAHFQYVNLRIKPEEHVQKAIEYANKALEIDPDSSWANFILAGFLLFEGNLKKAVSLIEIGIANNPNDPDLLFWAAWFYMMTGKISKVYTMVEQAMKVDPLNPWHFMTMGGADFFSGRFISAVENCTKAYKMQPENPMIIFWHAVSLAYINNYEDAISVVEKHMNNSGDDIMTQQSYFLKLTLTKDFEGVSQFSSGDFFTKSKLDLQHSYHNASFYSFLDQKEFALDWLENAVNKGFLNYSFMNEFDPFLKNIRNEPRFEKLMERVKYDLKNFEE